MMHNLFRDRKKDCWRFGTRVMKNYRDKTFMHVNLGFLFRSLACQTNNLLGQPLRSSWGPTLCGWNNSCSRLGGWQSCDKRRVCKRRISIIGIFRGWYVCYLMLSAFKWTRQAKEKHWTQWASQLSSLSVSMLAKLWWKAIVIKVLPVGLMLSASLTVACFAFHLSWWRIKNSPVLGEGLEFV